MRKNFLFLFSIMLAIALAVCSIFLYSQIDESKRALQQIERENISLNTQVESLKNEISEQQRTGPVIINSLEKAYLCFSNYKFIESDGKINIKDYAQLNKETNLAVYDNHNDSVFYKVYDYREAKGYFEVIVVKRDQVNGENNLKYRIYPNAFVVLDS